MKILKTPILKSFLLNCILFSFFQVNAQSFFNTFDKAQSLGEGISEVSGNFAHQAISYDGETEGFTNTFGLRAGYGFKGGFDLKFSWTIQRFKDGSATRGNYFVLKPKYSIGNGKFAVALPFGILTYPSDSESDKYISPEILFNHQFSQKFEFGTNARLVIPFDEYSENLVGIDIAFGLSKDLNQWAIRPEFGILFNPGEEGVFLNPGVSISYYLGRVKEKK